MIRGITNSAHTLYPTPRLWPEQGRTTYAAVFRGGSDSYLQVVQLDNWDFTATTLAPSQLDSIKGSEEETHAIYDVDSRAASSVSETPSTPTMLVFVAV